MKDRGISWKPSIRSSLQARITLSVLLPLIMIIGAFTALEYIRYRNSVLNHLSVVASFSAEVIKNSLQHAMLESDFSEVQVLLDSIGESEDFQVVYLLNNKGRVIFAPGGDGVGLQLDNRQADCQPCHELSPEKRPESVVVTNMQGERVFRSMQPLDNSASCAECHEPSERIIGLLLTDIPMAPMESRLIVDFRENLIWGVFTIIAAVVIVNLTLRGMVLKRLEKIVQALKQFGQDQLSLRLSTDDTDEIGQLASAFNDMGRRIEAEVAENKTLSKNLERQSKMRGELLKSLITAQEDERKRVARELHDELGQGMTALALQSERLSQLIHANPDQALEHLAIIKELIQQTTNQMYDLILALRPSALDDLGLATALQSHFERTLSGMEVDYEFKVRGMNRRLTPELEICLYRVFQEALSNIIRHAKADHIRVQLFCDNGIFEGEIIDNGRGFELSEILNNGNSPKGLGILGMYERIDQCGGNIEIITGQDQGTKIRVYVPLGEESDD